MVGYTPVARKMTTKKAFLEEESVVEEELKVNKDYAKRFNERKQREEKSRLEEKYGSASSDDDDSEDSESMAEEDEDGSLLTPAVDAQILTTISAIRAQDPALYDPTKSFFDESALEKTEKEWKRKERKLTLLDYQHQQLANGQLPSDEEEETRKTFKEEQEDLKKDFKDALHEESDDDLLLVKKEKTVEASQREEEEYRQFLLENLSKAEQSSQTMEKWLKFNQVRDQLDPNERFLIDFVLSRGWVDKTKEVEEDENLGIDEEIEERAEELEFKHNFRFEQPGAEMIPAFGRSIEGSLRRPDNKRKEQREAVTKRKAEEKAKEKEEVKRLKNIKKDEIKEKLKELEKVSGKKIAKEDIDLDSDFDPEEHDRRMAKLFDEKYYGDGDSNEDMSEIDDEKESHAPPKKAIKSVSKVLEKKEKKEKKLGDIMDEYYKLDYEDKIEDLPCRFKYVSNVPASSFGLDVKEILEANDKALNSHISIKKLAPYRPIEKQQHYIKTYGDKRRVWKFRNNLKEKK